MWSLVGLSHFKMRSSKTMIWRKMNYSVHKQYTILDLLERAKPSSSKNLIETFNKSKKKINEMKMELSSLIHIKF